MWIKSFHFLLVKLQIGGGTHLYIHLPVSLYVFQELLDCALDIMELACLFVPYKTYPHSSSTVSAHTVKELIQVTSKLFNSFTDCEPYDLVEVEANNVKVSIKIR